MSVEKWNESGRVWEEDHGLLDAEQVARCERADVAEPLRSPVPTRFALVTAQGTTASQIDGGWVW